MPTFDFGKTLMVLGALLFICGVLFVIGGRLGLGHLPGDLAWKRGNTSIYFPIVTSIVLSIVLTVVLNLFFRFFR
ncbi:MAG: DUF2905 domain-containing protein [Armatimonadota bacterium]|nr:DUF2905 domain-containing protein [Armatimonadota bacterium]